jgi:hypothetical protein
MGGQRRIEPHTPKTRFSNLQLDGLEKFSALATLGKGRGLEPHQGSPITFFLFSFLASEKIHPTATKAKVALFQSPAGWVRKIFSPCPFGKGKRA